MSIITKTEVCDNVPASLPPLSFQALIGDMKRIESLSNDKIMALESRLQAAEDEAKLLRKQNEELKSSLAAKERDSKLYYDQYQNIAAEFEDFKAKLGKDVELPKLNHEKIEAEIEPAIIVFDTDSENEESHEETILFTSPDLFSEPNSHDKLIPTANSTALQAFNPPKETEKPSATTTSPTETSQLDTILAQKVHEKVILPEEPQSEKRKPPLAISRKRARSESQRKSGAPLKKSRYTPKKLPTPTHFKCKTCPKLAFEKLEAYHEHLNEIHPEKTYLCGYCPYATSIAGGINNHIERTHRVVHNNNYTCELCKISFANAKSLAAHLRFYH